VYSKLKELEAVVVDSVYCLL